MSGITCVQFDNRRLISAGLDRVIRMWDIRSGRSLHKFLGHKVTHPSTDPIADVLTK